MIDPDNNLFFSDATGEPLNALQLHRLAVSGRADEAIAHPGSSSNTLYLPERHEDLVGIYELVQFRRRADWLSTQYPYAHPKRHPRNSTVLFYGEGERPEWSWLRWDRTASRYET